MKSIFLANYAGNIDYVYSKESIERLKELCDIDETKIYSQGDLETNPEIFSDVEYVFSTWSMPGGDVIKYLPKLKAAFYAAGSVQHFAKEFINNGARVFSAASANAVPVAEYTLAQILLANKGFYRARVTSKENYEACGEFSKKHCGNYGAKIGIIGVGMIGRTVIELLKPFKVDILVFDAFLSDEKAKELGVKKVSLEELFAECDIVSNHLANVPATVGMLKGEHFAKMKPYATFINTGRGAQIKEDEMLSVLKERPDITALLDVTIEEPPIENSPLYTLENVYLTPHIAGSQAKEVNRMAEYMVKAFEAVLENKPTNYEVTLKMLETMA